LTDMVAVRGGRGAWSVDVFAAFSRPRAGGGSGGARARVLGDRG
jgi:hypothetical protein